MDDKKIDKATEKKVEVVTEKKVEAKVEGKVQHAENKIDTDEAKVNYDPEQKFSMRK